MTEAKKDNNSYNKNYQRLQPVSQGVVCPNLLDEEKRNIRKVSEK